jgi:hypothetical protein
MVELVLESTPALVDRGHTEVFVPGGAAAELLVSLRHARRWGALAGGLSAGQRDR